MLHMRQNTEKMRIAKCHRTTFFYQTCLKNNNYSSLGVNCPSFRLGVDLDKIFKNGRHPLPASLAGTLAVQVINALEYLHSKGYTHNDIKVYPLGIQICTFTLWFFCAHSYPKPSSQHPVCPAITSRPPTPPPAFPFHHQENIPNPVPPPLPK